MKRNALRILLPLFSLLLILTLASCGAASKEDAAMNVIPSVESEIGKEGFGGDLLPTVDSSQVEERKVIKTYSISCETKTFDAALPALEEMLAAVGGYVESSSTSNSSLGNTSSNIRRHATYTLRIPAEKADTFVSSLGDRFHVTSSNSNAEDISETYYSIEARLEELLVERDALLDMLEDDATKKDYGFWMTVRERLSDVTQQIAVYQGQINRYDGKIAYSTVELRIREVLTYNTAELQGRGFGSRLGKAFSNGWNAFLIGLQDFTLWLAEALPTLVLLALLATGVILVVRAIRRRRKKKKTAQRDPAPSDSSDNASAR